VTDAERLLERVDILLAIAELLNDSDAVGMGKDAKELRQFLRH
jgi:hypothetical protein